MSMDEQGETPLRRTIIFLGKLLASVAALVAVITFTPHAVTVTRQSEELAWDAIDAIDQYIPDYERAKSLIQKASRRRETNGVVLLARAVLDLDIEPLDTNHSAQRLLTQASRKLRGSSLPQYYLGRIYAHKGDYCKAIEHFENAVRRNSEDPESISWLGRAISITIHDRTRCSIHTLDYGLRCLSEAARWPGYRDPMLYYRLADALLLHKKEIDDAMTAFWEGFHIDDNVERAMRYKARFWGFQLRDRDEARRILMSVGTSKSGWISYELAVLNWCLFDDVSAASDLRGVAQGTSSSSHIKHLVGAIEANAQDDFCIGIRRRSPLLWRDP